MGIDPTLKPKVVDTSHMASKKEQEDNPLGRMSFTEKLGYEVKNSLKLPKGFKTADEITKVDDLEFECGRLREMLATWLDRVTVDGVEYNVLVDPMNRQVELTVAK